MVPAGFSREQIASIAAAIACVAAVGIGLSLTIPLLSLEMERMGISNRAIGLNTAVAGLASIATVPFVPGLARRFGLLRLLWVTVAVVPIMIVLFKVTHNFPAWFPIRFVFSAALGALFVLSEYWIITSAPPARRGVVMGIYATVLAVGLAVGPLLLVALGTEGWPPYLGGVVLFSLAALPLVLAGDLSPSVESKPGTSLRSLILAAPVATLAALAFGAVETGSFALLPVYGVDLGLTTGQAALLLSAIAIGNVALQIPIGLLSDRFDRRLVLLLCSLGGAVGAAMMPVLAEHGWAMAVLLFLWGGVTGALYTVGLAHLGSRFSGPDLVSANAAFVLLYNIGLTAGPPVVGVTMDIFPPHGFALALSSFCIAYLAVVLLRFLATRHGQARHDP